MPLLTPPRRRGVEYLDAPDVDPSVVRRSLRDVALSNRLFGGVRAVLAELGPTLRAARGRGAPLTVLDVGTGHGDIPARLREDARRHGVSLATIGVDAAEELASSNRQRIGLSVCGDGRRLPFADRSVDVVTCSQVLHHFPDGEAVQLLRELDRVARQRVVVSELRRSWLAAGGIWIASFPLRFHPVSRHDGVVSVMRGFTRRELRESVRAAVGHAPDVRNRLAWRVTACWTPR